MTDPWHNRFNAEVYDLMDRESDIYRQLDRRVEQFPPTGLIASNGGADVFA